MARMHTGGHGKAKSRKPKVSITKAGGGISNAEEIKKIINEYAKQNMTPAMIGQRLKEKHNLPYIKQAFGARLGSILREQGVQSQLPADMMALIKRAVNMRSHLLENSNDQHNKMRLTRVESKIWRLSKYYKKEGVLPGTWKYDPEQAALLVKQQ